MGILLVRQQMAHDAVDLAQVRHEVRQDRQIGDPVLDQRLSEPVRSALPEGLPLTRSQRGAPDQGGQRPARARHRAAMRGGRVHSRFRLL